MKEVYDVYEECWMAYIDAHLSIQIKFNFTIPKNKTERIKIHNEIAKIAFRVSNTHFNNKIFPYGGSDCEWRW